MIHLYEIQRTIQTTWQVRDINIKRKLAIFEMKHLVFRALRSHEVDAGAYVGASDEREAERAV